MASPQVVGARSGGWLSVPQSEDAIVTQDANVQSLEVDDTAKPSSRRRPPVSVPSAVFNLTNTTMGIGMLSLAGVLAQAGIVVSVVLIFVFATLTVLSVMLLIDGAIATRAKSYEELARITVGVAGERYIQVALLANIGTACVGFLVSVKGLAGFALSLLAGETESGRHDDKLLLVLVATVVVPLSLLRSLDALKLTSMISLAMMVWFVGVSVLVAPVAVREDWACAKFPGLPVDRTPLMLPQNLSNVLMASSIIMSSFVCQVSVFPIWMEMEEGDASHGVPVQATRRRFRIALLVSVGVCTVFYLAAAFSGYLTWASAVASVDLVVQCYDPQSWYVLLIYIGLTVMCLFTHPLFLFVARNMVLRIAGYHGEIPYHIFVGVGLLLIFVTVVPAMLVSNLGYVLGIGSAFAVPALTLEMPAMCGIRHAETEVQKMLCKILLGVGVVIHVLTVLYCDL